MLKVRVIPTLLWKDFGLVKGQGFDSWRRVGTVLPAVRVYNTREVDELIFVDIRATLDDREPDYDEIESFSGDCFVPLTVGGGIRSIENVTKVLRAGADKVCINSAAYDDASLVPQASERFGSQCIVASVDFKVKDGKAVCVSHSGTRVLDCTVVSWCQELEKQGAGEILLTSVDRDGSYNGYETQVISEVSQAVSIPVIASGGAGNFDHMVQAVKAGASAVAAGAIYHFTENTPLEAKQALAQAGFPVRQPWESS